MVKKKKEEPEITEENVDFEETEQVEGIHVPEEKPEPEDVAPEQSAPKSSKLKAFFKSKKFKIAVPIIILIIAGVVLLVEPVKFGLLNIFSKANVEFEVVDQDTKVAIEDVQVVIGDQTGTTGKDGKVRVSGVSYGQASYAVTKDNYATNKGLIKVKTGTNSVGPIGLESQGTPVEIKLKNTLNSGNIKDFKVAIKGSEVSTLSSKEGIATLKVPNDLIGEVTLTLSADGYNTVEKRLKVKRSDNDRFATNLTPNGKHYFLTNRTGKLAVFASNLDGAGAEEVIAGGANNDTGTQLFVAPDGKHAVMISKRDNVKDTKGRIAQALFTIDLSAKTIKRIDEGAPYFGFLSWTSNNQVLYWISHEDYNRKDNNKLKTADVVSGKLATLDSSKDYRSYYIYQEDPKHAYYASSYNLDGRNDGTFSINLSDKSKKKLSQQYGYGYTKTEVGSVFFRNNLEKWFKLDFAKQSVVPAQEPSGPRKDVVYSPNKQKTAWIERRDGRTSVVVGDAQGMSDKQVTKDISVGSIRRWYSDKYIIFGSQERNDSTDYIVDIASGTTTKIADTFDYN